MALNNLIEALSQQRSYFHRADNRHRCQMYLLMQSDRKWRSEARKCFNGDIAAARTIFDCAMTSAPFVLLHANDARL